MSAKATASPVPRLALSVDEACAALGVSWDFFNEHVAAELRIVRRGRRKLVAVRELERWLADNSDLIMSAGDPGCHKCLLSARDRRTLARQGGPGDAQTSRGPAHEETSLHEHRAR